MAPLRLGEQPLQVPLEAVRVEGIGDVYVFVEQDLRARVSGLGDIVYAGNPESVDDRVDGFGSIEADD